MCMEEGPEKKTETIAETVSSNCKRPHPFGIDKIKDGKLDSLDYVRKNPTIIDDYRQGMHFNLMKISLSTERTYQT